MHLGINILPQHIWQSWSINWSVSGEKIHILFLKKGLYATGQIVKHSIKRNWNSNYCKKVPNSYNAALCSIKNSEKHTKELKLYEANVINTGISCYVVY